MLSSSQQCALYTARVKNTSAETTTTEAEENDNDDDDDKCFAISIINRHSKISNKGSLTFRKAAKKRRKYFLAQKKPANQKSVLYVVRKL